MKMRFSILILFVLSAAPGLRAETPWKFPFVVMVYGGYPLLASFEGGIISGIVLKGEIGIGGFSLSAGFGDRIKDMEYTFSVCYSYIKIWMDFLVADEENGYHGITVRYGKMEGVSIRLGAYANKEAKMLLGLSLGFGY